MITTPDSIHNPTHPCKCHIARSCPLHRAAPALVAALELVDEVWHRANLHPEINFLGDDEHEAWSAVRAALKLAKGE